MQLSNFLTGRLRDIVIWSLLLVAVAVALIELTTGGLFRDAPLLVLLAVVAFAAFQGGLGAGVIGVVVASGYGAYFLSSPEQLFYYDKVDGLRLMFFAVAAICTAVMMGGLRAELRVSQAHLKDQLEFRRAIDQSLGEGVYALDAEGRVTYMNPAAERLLGWSETELLGKVMHDVAHYRHADGGAFPHEECPMLRVLATGQLYRAEYDAFVRNDGSIFPAAHVSAPIKRHGKVVGVVVALRDMTERTQAEEAVQARVRQQAAIAALGLRAITAPDLMAILEDAARVVVQTLNVDLSKILELQPGEEQMVLRAGVGWKPGTIGHAVIAATPETHAGYALCSRTPVVIEDLENETRFEPPSLLKEHGVVSTMSVVVYRRDGVFGILEADSRRRRAFTTDDVHGLQSIANILTAIAQRKEFEDALAAEWAESERLEELDRLRRQFVLSVSHELRTPLSVAQGGLGMLETSSGDRLLANERQLLATARRSIVRLRMLIDDLLVYNQLEAGTLDLKREPVDVRKIVTNMLPHIYPATAEKRQRLVLDLPEALPSEGDPSYLAHALMNILTYVHERAFPGTAITMTGGCADDKVHFNIGYAGSGLVVDDEPVLQHFSRLGLSEVGEGVGLAVANTIMQLHEGYISVERSRDQETGLRIALPKMAETSSMAAQLTMQRLLRSGSPAP